MLAVKQVNQRMVKQLFNKNADITATDTEGKSTSLSLCVCITEACSQMIPNTFIHTHTHQHREDSSSLGCKAQQSRVTQTPHPPRTRPIKGPAR